MVYIPGGHPCIYNMSILELYTCFTALYTTIFCTVDQRGGAKDVGEFGEGKT